MTSQSRSNLAAALVYIQTRRYKDAEAALRREIGINPQDAYAYSLLALAVSAQERHKEAHSAAYKGVQLEPDSGYSHYVLALTLIKLDDPAAAMKSIREAIRLDPHDSRNYEVLARIYVHRREWQLALEAAQEGLRANPRDINCLNWQALALVHMGRSIAASDTIDSALAQNPENAFTHATKGWSLLHANEPRGAIKHFREALRLNPHLEWAREGMVEALKARNIFYRGLLAYYLWMTRLNPMKRWAIMLGGYFTLQFISRIPALDPIVGPVAIVYAAFVLFSWTGKPLFDLLLRLDAFGRMSLNAEDIEASNWVGLCLLACAVLFGIGIVSTEQRSIFWNAALQSLVMMIPVSGIYHMQQPQNRTLVRRFCMGMAGLIIVGLLAQLTGSTMTLYGFFVIGIIGYTWLANILIARESR